MKIWVLGSESSNGVDPIYRRDAIRVGKAIAQRGLSLIYGGTTGGLIETAAAAALAEGGEVIGVIPQDHADAWGDLIDFKVTRQVVMPSVAARQTYMFAECDAAIILPGGHGTLYEMFQATTGFKNDEHTKPLGLLNTLGYYESTLAQLELGKAQGFIRQSLSPLIVDAMPERLVEALIARARIGDPNIETLTSGLTRPPAGLIARMTDGRASE